MFGLDRWLLCKGASLSGEESPDTRSAVMRNVARAANGGQDITG